MTIEELKALVDEQQKKISHLEEKLDNLKSWSDLNDYWLREMIDALTESVDKNHDLIFRFHNEEK